VFSYFFPFLLVLSLPEFFLLALKLPYDFLLYILRFVEPTRPIITSALVIFTIFNRELLKIFNAEVMIYS